MCWDNISTVAGEAIARGYSLVDHLPLDSRRAVGRVEHVPLQRQPTEKG